MNKKCCDFGTGTSTKIMKRTRKTDTEIIVRIIGKKRSNE